MSLVIALKGIDSVVVAADTQAISDEPDGMCRFKSRKLRIVNNGRWALGFTGSDDGLGLIDTLDRRRFDFGRDALMGVPAYARQLWKEYQRRQFSGVMSFLLAGMDHTFPFIECWSFDTPRRGRPISLIGPSICHGDHEAIGILGHGGLYFTTEYHREEMDTTQMVSLAHFSVTEVAKHEVLVGRPVDIAIVTRDGATCWAESELPALRRRSESIGEQLQSMFWEPRVKIPKRLLPTAGLVKSRRGGVAAPHRNC